MNIRGNLTLFCAICFFTCTKSPINNLQVVIPNNPPSTPILLNPTQGQMGCDTTITLRWSCSDPDKDTLKYDIYFDESINPRIYYQSVSVNYYTIKGLDFNKKYYWKVCANDDSSTTCSQVSFFTTKVDSASFKVPILGLWKDTVVFYSSLIGDSCIGFDYLFLGTNSWYEDLIQYSLSPVNGQILPNSKVEIKNQGTIWPASADSLFLQRALTYYYDADTTYQTSNSTVCKLKYQLVNTELWLWGWRLGIFYNYDIVKAVQ